MKGYTLAAGLILAAASAVGQTSSSQDSDERPCISRSIDYATANLDKAKKNFLWTFQSDNEGVLESVLAHATHMRIMVPQEDMRDIEALVNQLSSTGPTPIIRYKAYLATQVFANPALFHDTAAANYDTGDDFFNALALRLQQTMLGSTVK